MTGNFTNQRQAAKAARDAQLSGCATLVWTLLFVAVFFTLGWNYGVTEIVQNYGGPDANINILQGALTVLAVRIFTKR